MQATLSDIEEQQKISLWVSKAQAGEKNAFALLYKKFGNSLYLFCRRLTGNESIAEEIVQETFIKAWLSLPQFRNEGGFYSWLRQIASRVAIDRLRLKDAKIWHNPISLDAYSNEAIGYDSDKVSRSNQVEMTLDLEKMISGLPDGARTVLVLYEIEGYNHREIGEMLGIAEGTSKAQLSRARKQLSINFNEVYRTSERTL